MLQSANLYGEHSHTLPRVIPPKRHPSTPRFISSVIRNTLAVLPAEAYDKPILERRVLGSQVLMVMDPDLVEEILKHSLVSYPKGSVFARVLGPIFGLGLLTAEGQDWRAKRRLSAPAFRPNDLGRYVPVLVQPFGELACAWANAPGVKRIDEAMTRATFQALIDAIFSGSRSIDAALISRALTTVLDTIGWQIAYAYLKLPVGTPHPGRNRLTRAVRDMRDAVRRFIRARRERSDAPQDLAQALMDATDSDGHRALDEEDLIDMMLTLLLAGHETSANGLAWSLFLLAHYPEHQKTLRCEVAEIVGDSSVKSEHIGRLKATERFIKESLRLFPPVAVLRRSASEAVRLGPVTAEAGCTIIIPIYVIHRHSALWNAPHQFDPDRFLPEREAMRHRLAYLPFSAGPRICLGAGFAMAEMTAGLATLVRHLEFCPVPGFQPQPRNRLSLRSENGVKVEVRPITETTKYPQEHVRLTIGAQQQAQL